MTEGDKQPKPANPFINVGRPAFAEGGTGAKKLWAILTTIGFGLFWVCLMFTLSEFFGPRDFSVWAEVLCVAGLALGIGSRIMMTRKEQEAR